MSEMNQILNELIGIPDITNIIEEYINGDRLYWKSQYNCIIRLRKDGFRVSLPSYFALFLVSICNR